MSVRGPLRGETAGSWGASAVAFAGVVATGETPLQLTTPLVWVMLGMTVSGAIITYAFLVYAVWKFRDRTTRHRHG